MIRMHLWWPFGFKPFESQLGFIFTEVNVDFALFIVLITAGCGICPSKIIPPVLYTRTIYIYLCVCARMRFVCNNTCMCMCFVICRWELHHLLLPRSIWMSPSMWPPDLPLQQLTVDASALAASRNIQLHTVDGVEYSWLHFLNFHKKGLACWLVDVQ